MWQLIGSASFIVAALGALAALVELRTAWRLARADDVRGTIDAGHGSLIAPISHRHCAVFVVVLQRRRLDQRFMSGAEQFSEQRPYTIHCDGRDFAVDHKQRPVPAIGFRVDEQKLPFLPQAVLGLLVQRFGHLGHLWAEDHVVVARESIVADGEQVHVFVERGEVRSISAVPLQTLAVAACKRALRGSMVAAVAGVVALLVG
ncbi:MAG TPA: hypothetical protein VGF99_10710 [Myxococcota bacterium]